ncbi:MAG TPA: class I SAM-dependent RNA methyltransferase [Phycisphaerae bacterium]|nr:class I SAM-dependent RNA methyltransferase [Phycisphaerae bacterium]HRY68646.1 class I SAM-dependent RNA methyltransferase [Phycisphaerae bacterium]HSA25472.1 class I SAM-dependent RNA methyltransferase [Phycisphaerae bacterium]
MNLDVANTIRVSCAPALAEYLAKEIEALGYSATGQYDTGVDLTGTLGDAMRLNLYLRTAMNVLYFLREFPCSTVEDLYREVGFIDWEHWLDPDGYLSVVSRVDTPSVNNETFANKKVKDAIVDRIQDKAGRRPNSGPGRDRFVVNLFWFKDRCWLYFNTSGAKLSNRGYRKIPHSAPMVETLAAGVLMAAGYDGRMPLVNPMCGSGTLAIEAALMATGRPPGLLRSNYGFMHALGFDDQAWQVIRREARKVRAESPPGRIIASDIDPQAVDAARRNAATAGVDQLIEFHVCDFADTPLPEETGMVMLNPEYGERLGKMSELEVTYKRIGDFFKQRCPGWTGYVFTGNMELAKKVGLRASRRIPFFNARIECRLLKYELYPGTRRRVVETPSH